MACGRKRNLKVAATACGSFTKRVKFPG